MLYGSTYLLSRTTILREQNSSTPSGAPKQRIAMHNKRRGLISGMSSKFEEPVPLTIPLELAAFSSAI
jgi:hypothetical protein